MEPNDQSSTSGSWNTKLYNILCPAPPNSATPRIAKNSSRFRHSPGDIWKHAFSTSIYHDLSGTTLEHNSAGAVTWRRFVRVEHIGLSGVVFYQILVPSTSPALPSIDNSRHSLTLENVFGDMNNLSDAGMDLDDLLDVADAKMVYFPAYACTSFTIGHVMSAFLLGQPQHRPWPAYRGFSVCLGDAAFSPTLPPSDIYTPEDVHIGGDPENSSQISSLGQLRYFGKSLMDALSSEADNPYIALCIRSSSLDAVSTSDCSGTREELESVTSTVGSTGPPTPPSSSRNSQSQIKPMQSLCSYDDLLSFLDLDVDESEN